MRRWCANVTPRGPTARFTGPFCFFDLPRELRHMICYLARTATPDLYRATLNERPSPLIDTTTHYQQEADGWMPDRHYPLCVRVSHAFLSEAMEQYFRNVGWVARIPGSIFTTRIYLNSAKFSNPSKFQIMLETSVLTCKRRIVGWIPNSDYSRDVIEVYNAWPMDPSEEARARPSWPGRSEDSVYGPRRQPRPHEECCRDRSLRLGGYWIQHRQARCRRCLHGMG
ncbi:hypothetical protein JI435_024050 [Parastagonospora nodorum SN15]|uniref:F-box domain-containing protein n=1 Tax=Phaeosphaeria nodorum (strain SN15 / ATCC MYA-4574 / FGSC 10173) TaxID=321614 RepID=A0A7U2HUF7_PHANO|nr:hypothetical protein JI435_024050 [Parastagonospora nodorum SN15]